MKAAFAPALSWWDARAPRERLLLWVMGMALVVWIVVAAVLQPLQAAQARAQDRVMRYDRALAVVQSLPIATGAVTAPDDRPLNRVITETAAAFQLTIRRLEPEGPRIRVVLDEAPFDAVILWLDAVQHDHALRVAEAEMIRRPALGVVTATLVLER